MSKSEDHLAILALYANYNKAIDAGDADAWLAAFMKNGVFHHPTRSWTGQDDLRQFVEERTAKFSTNKVVDQRHWNDAIALDIADGKATGTCDLLVVGVTREDGSPKVVARGRYEDRLERGEAGWRFAERRLIVL